MALPFIPVFLEASRYSPLTKYGSESINREAGPGNYSLPALRQDLKAQAIGDVQNVIRLHRQIVGLAILDFLNLHRYHVLLPGVGVLTHNHGLIALCKPC